MQEKNFNTKAKVSEAFLCISIIFLIFYVQNSILELDARVLTYLSCSFLYALFKIILSLFYKPDKSQFAEKNEKVSVIIPNFNESVESVIGCMESLMNQTYPVHEIIFIDDGSTDDSAYVALKAFKKEHEDSHINFIVHKLPENQGKRVAQAWGFEQATGDYVMLVDSDTHFYNDVIEELMMPMNDSSVGAVVGHIRPRNQNKNFITLIQDIGYMSAFRLGRAAQSVTNSIVVCSGACSMHRKSYIIENLPEFLEKEVYGIPCTSGDDRILTIFALQAGYKTKYQATAICETDVPEKIGVLFKQRARWERSAHILTVKSLVTFGWKKPLYSIFVIGETYMWLIGSIITVLSLFFVPQVWELQTIISVISYYFFVTWLTNIYCIHNNVKQFSLVVLLNILYGVFLFCVRIYAIFTINNGNWSTR